MTAAVKSVSPIVPDSTWRPLPGRVFGDYPKKHIIDVFNFAIRTQIELRMHAGLNDFDSNMFYIEPDRFYPSIDFQHGLVSDLRWKLGLVFDRLLRLPVHRYLPGQKCAILVAQTPKKGDPVCVTPVLKPGEKIIFDNPNDGENNVVIEFNDDKSKEKEQYCHSIVSLMRTFCSGLKIACEKQDDKIKFSFSPNYSLKHLGCSIPLLPSIDVPIIDAKFVVFVRLNCKTLEDWKNLYIAACNNNISSLRDFCRMEIKEFLDLKNPETKNIIIKVLLELVDFNDQILINDLISILNEVIKNNPELVDSIDFATLESYINIALKYSDDFLKAFLNLLILKMQKNSDNWFQAYNLLKLFDRQSPGTNTFFIIKDYLTHCRNYAFTQSLSDEGAIFEAFINSFGKNEVERDYTFCKMETWELILLINETLSLNAKVIGEGAFRFLHLYDGTMEMLQNFSQTLFNSKIEWAMKLSDILSGNIEEYKKSKRTLDV